MASLLVSQDTALNLRRLPTTHTEADSAAECTVYPGAVSSWALTLTAF